jgi:hypothetical protein
MCGGYAKKGFWTSIVERRGPVLPSFDIEVNSSSSELELWV